MGGLESSEGQPERKKKKGKKSEATMERSFFVTPCRDLREEASKNVKKREKVKGRETQNISGEKEPHGKK